MEVRMRVEIVREMEVETEFWKKFIITFEYFAIFFLIFKTL